MSKMSDYPVAYVYVTYTTDIGAEEIRRYVVAHDGALQAGDEAIRALFGVGRERLPSTWRIRSIDVFENVHPRTFQYEAVTRPDFKLREIR